MAPLTRADPAVVAAWSVPILGLLGVRIIEAGSFASIAVAVTAAGMLLNYQSVDAPVVLEVRARRKIFVSPMQGRSPITPW